MMMKRFIASMVLLLIGSICFTGNVIAVAINAERGDQSEVGYSLLIICGLCVAAIFFIAFWLERDYQYTQKGEDIS
ncbi:hypothetical protein [Planomicrobium okeanokoites]|uniref:hypothetical protein n=1 Tax=Planomicrobium okeanokoites TaxID=244 RepID=UPI002491BC48|nr:hypothetical protein [Planomicrobium okeanokoites]